MWTLVVLCALAWNAALAVFLVSFIREEGGAPAGHSGKLQLAFTVAGIACSAIVALAALVA